MHLPHMPTRVRQTTRCLTMAATSAAALLVAVPAADASSPTDAAASAVARTVSHPSVSRSFTLPKGTTRATLSLGSSAVQVVKSPQEEIICEYKLSSPHWVPPMHIATMAGTHCSAPVVSLSIRVALSHNGTDVAIGDNQNNRSASITTETSALCVVGSWTSRVDGDIIFGPEFDPPASVFALRSPAVPVSICKN